MKIILSLLLLAGASVHAQELFVYTEPASNMPKGSLGLRFTNMLMKEKYERGYTYHLIPELMWGANKNLMLHAGGFISNAEGPLNTEGFEFYAKYRFLSKDEVHAHFRMAAFAKLSYNNSDIHQEEIDLNGHNSGWQTGLIATGLMHKTALSLTTSYSQAADNNKNKFPAAQSAGAFNYSASIGTLVLPHSYTSYKQTNLNLMLEILGQTLKDNGKAYLDAAPAIQFIINSQARLDFGYRQQLMSSMYRTAPNGFLVRFEYLFFNAFKKGM